MEIREKYAYIHTPSVPGAGGLPIGMGGRAVSLLSGGLDSPVSSYMICLLYTSDLSTLHLQQFYKKLLAEGRVERIESQKQPKGLSAKTCLLYTSRCV